MVKMTFTLDEETVAKLRLAARRLSKPQSFVVREAVADYSARLGRLGERERLRLLTTFDRVVARIPIRPDASADREIRAVRLARHRGSRRQGL